MAPDSQILKFTKDGKFLLQVGKKRVRRNANAGAGAGEGQVAGYSGGSNDTENFGRVAKIFVDQKENEAYIADGYLNKRVAVLDADTGKMKRWWGAYGNKPDDTPMPPYDPAAAPTQQFHNPVHCADMSVDRLIYVCDRVGDRLQIFTPEGKFVKEAFFETNTKNAGSVWDIAFSRTRSSATSTWRRREREGEDHRSPDAEGADHLRRRRPSPDNSTACTPSRPTRRETSTQPRPMRENGSSDSSPRE